VKIYQSTHGIPGFDGKEIEFKDHSGEFPHENGYVYDHVALPNPLYLKIHAAVCGVLHMSGTGKFLEEVLQKFIREDGSSAVHSLDGSVLPWDDLERSLQISDVKEHLYLLQIH
jgi:hypothetical protein